ncbi:MAG TPA: 2-phospho-L-lactate guanylyltransferase, partial [Catenuloplanes sp.]
MGEAGWAVVVPVKRLAWAKTRLRGVLDAERHQSLALALARDTLTAVRGCPDVVDIQVVTDDPRVADAALALGAAVAPDPPGAG